MVENGTWLEGVFVFPQGDIVIRLHKCIYGKTERTYEASNLYRFEFEKYPSFNYCSIKGKFLKVKSLDVNGRVEEER